MTIDFSKLPPEQLEIASKIVAEATRQGVDPDFALAIAGAETRGSYRHANKDGVITSPKGAVGIMQIMPSTVELYRKLKPDLVTMDITMREKDGIEAAGEILGLDPSAKIIMVTALGQESLLTKAIKLGVKDFVVKPFPPERLQKAAEKALS